MKLVYSFKKQQPIRYCKFGYPLWNISNVSNRTVQIRREWTPSGKFATKHFPAVSKKFQIKFPLIVESSQSIEFTKSSFLLGSDISHIWRKDEFCSILKNVSRHLFHKFWLLFFRKATNVCKPQGSINSSSKSLILISNLFNSNDFKFKRMCDVCEFGRITTNSNHYPRSPLKLIAFIGRKVIQSINGWRHFFVFRTNIHDTINKQMRCSRFNFINYNYIFSA